MQDYVKRFLVATLNTKNLEEQWAIVVFIIRVQNEQVQYSFIDNLKVTEEIKRAACNTFQRDDKKFRGCQNIHGQQGPLSQSLHAQCGGKIEELFIE